MAGCIRRAPPPRGEGGSDTEEFAKSTTKTDKNGTGVNRTNSGQVTCTDITTSDPNSAAARQKSIIQIYTDWANHYLERGRSKRYIQDLQNDVSDGVLLADVIEAVTGAKVPDINRKPKGANQMLENINSCLSFLGNLGVNTEEATAKDIKDGNLKTVLGLFFSLSRFKQAQKAAAAAAQVQQQQQQQINVTPVAQPKINSESTAGNEMMLSKLPSPFKSPSSTGIGVGAHRSSGLPLSQAMAKGHSTSSLSLSNSGIPAPSSGGATNPVVQRRSYVNDRTPARNSFTPSSGIMGGLGSVVHTGGGVSIGAKASSRSRSGSPLHSINQTVIPSVPSSLAGNNPSTGGGGSSFIPAPRGISVVARERNNVDRNQSRPSSTSSTSSVSHLPVKSNGVTYRHGGAARGSAAGGGVSIPGVYGHHATNANNNQNNNQLNNNNNSMLDKFKLFNSKDKASNEKTKGGAVSKRTSSSSGFSSARSERSDSSTSLCSEPKSTPDGASSSSEPPSVSNSTTTTPSSALTPNEEHTISRNRVVPPPTATSVTNNDTQPRNVVKTPAVKTGIAKKPFSRAKPIGSRASSREQLSGSTTSIKGSTDDSKKVTRSTEDRKKQHSSSTLNKAESAAIRNTKASNLKKVKSTSTLLLNASSEKSDKMDANKTSEADISSPNGQSGGPNSGIPKPTAAVKGTSKPALKDEPNSSSSSGKGADDIYVPVTIPAPLTLTDTTDPNTDNRANIPRSRSDRGRDGIAMVSPIMSNATANSKLDSNATMEPSNKSSNNEKKESIAKSSSSSMHDSGLSATNNSNNSSLSDSALRETSEDGDEVMLNIKPMLPILRASPYGYTRSLGPLSSSNSSNGRPLSSRIHGSSSSYSTSSPSQQRLASLSRHGLTGNNQDSRLFGAGVSSLKRVLDADYGVDGDVMGSDVHASGYLSDGDVLRLTSGGSSIMYGSCAAASSGSRNQDEIYSCGYTSEGGASLYGRRVIVGSAAVATGSGRSTQQKSGGLSSGRNAKTINVLQDDSLDDSSSISSGVSDTINEFSTDDNLTGSSLSSEPNNPYGSLKRGPRESSSNHSKGLSLSEHHQRHHSENNHSENSSRSSRKQNLENNHHGSGNSTSGSGRVSKSSVKKTDSSMQTESSAFHHSNATSSAAWKKYMAQQQQSQQQQAQAVAAQEAMSAHNHQGVSGGKKKGGSSSSSSSSGSKNKSMAVVNGVTEAFKGKSNKLTLSKDDFKRPPVEGGGSVRGSCESLPQSSGGKSSSSDKKGRSYSVSGSASTAAQGLVAYGQIKRSSGSLSNGSVIVCATNGQSNKSSSSKKNKSQDLNSLQVQSHVAAKTTLERKGKVKVCANTQTTNQDLYVTGATALSDSEYSSLSRRHPGGSSKQHQYMLTSPTLGGLRERAYGGRASSLTNGASPSSADYVTLAGLHSLNSSRDARGPRLSIPGSGRLAGGSESDNYVSLDLTSNYGSSNSPYAWIRPGGSISSAASVASAPAGRYCGGSGMTGGLTEADSMESLASAGSTGVHSQVNGNGGLGTGLCSLGSGRGSSPIGGAPSSATLTHARLTLHQRELTPSPHRLSRSNSIRSTKSEKLYPSMLTRSADIAEQAPPPTITVTSSNNPLSSPTNTSTSCGLTSQGGQRYMFPLSPVNPMSAATPSGTSSLSYGSSRSSAAMSHYIGGLLSRIGNKDEDVHGSSLSLVSTSSSLYSTAEEKQAHEIRKLRRELEQAHEKVATLTSQLTTNAHMVAAFEQSLSNMTTRLQHLTASSEQKDSELIELRTTIEALKKQSAEAGLTKAALQSMQAVQRSTPTPPNITIAPQLVRRHTFNTTKDSVGMYHSTALQEHRISRQLSTDSVSSVNSMSSACSTASKSGDDNSKKKKSKKGWLRSSFSKAFSRSKKNRHGSVSDVEDPRQFQSDSSTPNSPLLGSYANVQANHYINNKIAEAQKMNENGKDRRDSESSGTESKDDQTDDLRKQLREKDMVLTDIRLEALTSAHQLEGLRETLNKLRNEMSSLKQDNDRLQRLVSTKSLASSQSSLPLRNSVESLDKRLSVSEQSEHHSVDVYLNDAANDRDGKRVVISVFQGSHGDFEKFKSQANNRVLIGSVVVSGKTKWDLLDNVVKKTFKEYVLRVDPVSNLGLNAESVFSYHIGDIVRSKDSELPELLPCGYFVGESSDIQVVIKGTKQNSVDALAFETLIPKSIVQRYMSLLTEHRRIILCGPSGTGKTYLAQKLAEFLVLKNGKDLVPGTVATFSVDHKSAKELRQYLSNVAEQCESSEAGDLPTVIILDNLHHVGSLGEVFNGFLSAKYHKCPFIIGTMNQATCSTTNLQLHHNFRWVLCANHMEPVKGFLGRYLRRKLLDEEIRNGSRNPELTKVVDWMPKVWQQLNKFLETHSSSDVTIGPRLFLSCPLDVNGSQVWFTDLWNYSIVPYLLEAVREGLQLYGRRAPWEDPAGWVIETYPWACSPGSRDWPQLLRLRPEDVGYEGHPGPGGMSAAKNPHSGGSDVETDPLLNMLMRLQEAATYSSPHSNDSDSTSQDGHSSCSGGSGALHADDVLNAGIESTL